MFITQKGFDECSLEEERRLPEISKYFFAWDIEIRFMLENAKSAYTLEALCVWNSGPVFYLIHNLVFCWFPPSFPHLSVATCPRRSISWNSADSLYLCLTMWGFSFWKLNHLILNLCTVVSSVLEVVLKRISAKWWRSKISMWDCTGCLKKN